MLLFHDGSEYRSRAVSVWAAQAPRLEPDNYRDDYRDYFAGYCLDAIERSPAGSTKRIEGTRSPEPFACPSFTCYRD